MGGSVVVKSSTREPCEHLSLFKAALCSLMQPYAVSVLCSLMLYQPWYLGLYLGLYLYACMLHAMCDVC
jgi:hypothetical protein